MNEFISEQLYEYLIKHSSEEPQHLKKLNKETHLKILNPRMLSGHIQGRFLSLITKIHKPKWLPHLSQVVKAIQVRDHDR